MATFCTSCGAPLEDAVKFCTNCGAQNATPQQQPYAQPPAPAKKKLNPPVLIGAAAALVALIAIIAISAHKDGPGPKPPSGDAAVAMNALAGSWGRHEKKLPYWVFGTDGRFAYYDAQRITNYDTYMTSYYERWVQGKYRVNGYTIELYDCRVSSYFKYGGGWKYFDKSPYDLPANTLLDTPLPKNGDGSTTETTDDFTVMFEFQSATRLRLVMDRKWDQYDSDFDYCGGSHNVPVPSQRIPDRVWPENLLPPDVPAYGEGGRVREVDDTSHKGEVSITIDQTTREVFAGYGQRLLQAGWTNPWGDEDTQSLIEEDGSMATFEKGRHRLLLYFKEGTAHVGYFQALV